MPRTSERIERLSLGATDGSTSRTMLSPLGSKDQRLAVRGGRPRRSSVALVAAARHDLRRVVFEVVSRNEELASLRAFIGAERRGPAALVLEGEAGMGKSTLWTAGVEYARAQGFCVLASRPAEAERGLAHVGLGDLFDGVLDDVLPVLSAPRRRALQVALLIEDGSGDPVDRGALPLAVRD